MCVIMVANSGVRPTEEQVHLGWEANKFGGGVAWQEDGVVKWIKGLNEEEMQEFNKKLPFPYVLHFRVPSGGTSTLPGVCHPFPIEGKVSLALKGTSKTGVLFHNGFWTGWKDKLQTAAVTSRFRLPPGSWSDTRGLAWMTSHFGLGILELIDEKVIVMTPKFIHTFGNGWQVEEGVIFSNMTWKQGAARHQGSYHGQGAAAWMQNRGSREVDPIVGSFRRPGSGGNDQRRLPSGETEQKAVEEGAAKSGSTVEGEKVVAATVVPPTQTQVRQADQSNWARSINGKSFSTSGATYPYHQDQKCHDCQSAKADIWEHGHRRCWNCWDLANKAKDEVNKANPVVVMTGKVRESTCNFCNMNRAIHRTLGDNKWMCNQCWINGNRPKLRLAEEETVLVPQPSGSVH